jgi:hypothetical protein
MASQKSAKRGTAAPDWPAHSWSIDRWPVTIFPNSPSRARYLLREHRRELLEKGAISRVGRQLVIVGDRYLRWLEAQKGRAREFNNGAARMRSGRVARAVPTTDAAPPGVPVIGEQSEGK